MSAKKIQSLDVFYNSEIKKRFIECIKVDGGRRAEMSMIYLFNDIGAFETNLNKDVAEFSVMELQYALCCTIMTKNVLYTNCKRQLGFFKRYLEFYSANVKHNPNLEVVLESIVNPQKFDFETAYRQRYEKDDTSFLNFCLKLFPIKSSNGEIGLFVLVYLLLSFNGFDRKINHNIMNKDIDLDTNTITVKLKDGSYFTTNMCEAFIPYYKKVKAINKTTFNKYDVPEDEQYFLNCYSYVKVSGDLVKSKKLSTQAQLQQKVDNMIKVINGKTILLNSVNRPKLYYDMFYYNGLFYRAYVKKQTIPTMKLKDIFTDLSPKRITKNTMNEIITSYNNFLSCYYDDEIE